MRRPDLTAGQAWTSGLGLLLGGVLLATSLPPVWERRGQVPAPVSGLAAVPAPPGTSAALPPAVEVPVPGVAAPPLPAGDLLPPAVPLVLAPAPAPAGPPPVGSSAPPPPPPLPPAGTSPLTVLEGGWSTTDPAGSQGVPEGALPVGARLGSPVETSYVRLVGSGTVLRLPVSDDATGTFGEQDAVVRACRITEPDWQPQRDGPAVPYDVDACVATTLVDGALEVDLAAVADRTSRAGFALVAAPPSPLVAFRLSLTTGAAP